jgi:hypothetical protein
MNNICWLETNNNIITTRYDYFKIENNSNHTFHVNNIFDKLDWSKEPTKSLKNLYKERAEQIRSLYNYIILYFSGGSDSITVLNTFLDNNILIDEIVINCIPQVKEPIITGSYAKKYLKYKSFKGKITINELNLEIINTINKKQLWKNVSNFTGLLHNLLRFDIDFYEENNLLNINKRSGKVAHITGSDYPTIVREGDSYYSYLSFSSFTLPPHSEKNVSFFTSTQFPYVHIKQCHILAKYMYKTNLESEKDCKISIRDEFNINMFALKTGGELKKQVRSGVENSLIINNYIEDNTFKDLYINSVYKDIIKPRMNMECNFYKKYLLFGV